MQMGTENIYHIWKHETFADNIWRARNRLNISRSEYEWAAEVFDIRTHSWIKVSRYTTFIKTKKSTVSSYSGSLSNNLNPCFYPNLLIQALNSKSVDCPVTHTDTHITV